MAEEKTLRKKVLDWVEKDRFSLTTAVIYVFVIAAFRSFLDSLVTEHGWYNIYEMAHYVFVAYPEFLLGALVIFLLTKAPIRKVWNVILLGFWILLIPPIVDRFILREYGPEVGVQYGYLAMDELLPMLTSLLINPFQRPEDVGSTGQMVMFIMMIGGSIAYVALRNDLIGKFIALFDEGKKKLSAFLSSLIRTILTYYGLFFSFWLIGALQFITRIGEDSVVVFNVFSFNLQERYYMFFTNHNYDYESEIIAAPYFHRVGLLESLAYNQFNLLFGLVFVLVCIILILISLYLSYRETLLRMLKNIRPVDTSLLTSAAFVGIASLHLIDPDFSKGWAVDPFYLLHVQYVLFCLIAVFLLSQFSFLIDDIYGNKRNEERDNPLSNGTVPKYHYKQLASSYAVSALFISFVLGWWTLILAILWIIISIVFSSSVSNNRFGSPTKGVIFGALAFFIGYYTPGRWIAFILEHSGGEWINVENHTVLRTPGIASQTFLILIWVLIGMVVITLLSDSNTYFYTRLADKLESNKTGVIIMVGVLFLFPLVVHFSLLSFIITASLAFGTIMWYLILDNRFVAKLGFLFIFVFYSLSIL